GVHVYIPKVVVTGPYNAGKSTFVHTVSDTAVSVDRLGTTVALDHGHVTINGVTADIFGTPGQARFDPILRTVAGQALGVIVLVDATKPDTFPRARELLEKTVVHGIPVIIAANKQDLPGALTPEEVEARLKPPRHVKVIGCSGQDRASSRRLLETMNDNIVLRGMAPQEASA
ncbi:MAG: GTP-binding protein, partial [Candidatus Thermoplasmatota archaeon]|nr:GTP-binding protein [Candidatus Thermoplasmatota archaeon]